MAASASQGVERDELQKQVDGALELVRQAFEDVVKRFPGSARHWIMYIEFEERQKALDRVEQIFTRCLRSVVSLELWKFYLNFIRRTHSVAASAPPAGLVGVMDPAQLLQHIEARKVILQAFELVLSNVGLDKEAGGLWHDYLTFLAESETYSPYEEQLKMDAQRKVYHRVLSIPVANIESIWKDYDAFENGLNKLTAKKLLTEKSAGYMSARTAFREMKIMLKVVDLAVQRNWVAVPPRFSDHDCAVLAAWKKYIVWEKSNPLQLEDKNQLNARIIYSYKSALGMLRFFPEIWYDASMFMVEIGKMNEAMALLEEGTEVIPKSLLLHFALAELKESEKREFSEISTVFDKLISHLEQGIGEINQRYDDEKKTMLKELQEGTVGEAGLSTGIGAKTAATTATDAISASAAAAAAVDGGGSAMDGEMRERARERQKEIEAKIEAKIGVARKSEIEEARRGFSLAWIVYMRVARRCQNVKAARNVFKLARKSSHCTFHVYVAAALMEYYCSQDTSVACKVFEAGIKAFSDSDGLAALFQKYLEFLVQVNDENNVRAMFERALVALPPEQTRSIWAVFQRYEINYGELSNITKAEERRRAMFTSDTPETNLKAFAERCAYLDLENVGDQDLGLKAQMAHLSKPTHTDDRDDGGSDSYIINSNINHQDVGLEFRGHSLESVNPDRYPRPDFSQWTSFRPERPSRVSSSSAASIPDSSKSGVTTSSVSGSTASGMGKLPSTSISTGPILMVPEAIVKLIEVLPPGGLYNGPYMPVDEIIEILKRLPVQMPSSTPLMIPVPGSMQPLQARMPQSSYAPGLSSSSLSSTRREIPRLRPSTSRSNGGGGGFNNPKRKGGSRWSDEEDRRKRFR